MPDKANAMSSEDVLFGLVYPSSCVEFVTLFTDENIARRRCKSLNDGERILYPNEKDRWSVKRFAVREVPEAKSDPSAPSA